MRECPVGEQLPAKLVPRKLELNKVGLAPCLELLQHHVDPRGALAGGAGLFDAVEHAELILVIIGEGQPQVHVLGGHRGAPAAHGARRLVERDCLTTLGGPIVECSVPCVTDERTATGEPGVVDLLEEVKRRGLVDAVLRRRLLVGNRHRHDDRLVK